MLIFESQTQKYPKEQKVENEFFIFKIEFWQK